MIQFNGSVAWNLRYAPHLGFLTAETPYFKHSVGSLDPVAHIDYIASLGFAGVADKDLALRPVAEQTRIGEALARHGLEMGAFADQPERPRSPWGSCDRDDVAFLRQRLEASLETSRRVGGGRISLAAIRDMAVPLKLQFANMVENLRWAAELVARSGVMLCIEPTSESRVPGMVLHHVLDAHLIVKAVNHPSIRLLFDTVHVQIQDGDLTRNFQDALESIGLLQIADHPGRCEPGGGEINFVYFLRAVRESSYQGLIELEHFHARPGEEGEQHSLQALYEIDRQLAPQGKK